MKNCFSIRKLFKYFLERISMKRYSKKYVYLGQKDGLYNNGYVVCENPRRRKNVR